ncbi:MAG: ABC transporter permease [Bacteroidota bacterium]
MNFWQTYRKNLPAVVGLVYLVVCFLVAIFGYVLAPDHTYYANLQNLELAKQAPGTKTEILKVPLNQKDELGNWLVGWPQRFLPIALDPTEPVEAVGSYLTFVRRSGQRDSLPLERFPKMGVEDLKSQYIEKQTFLLGSDAYGRDVLSRILLGTRISLSVGILSVFISLCIGVLLGSLAGYWGGWVDRIIVWLISVLWSIPTLLLALAISFVLGKGFWQVFVAIGLSMWVEVARIVRGQILSVREDLYIEAAKAQGFTDVRILFHHILPNIVSPIIVMGVANFGAAVLIESGLSFLGIGVEVPIPTWGRMVYEGYTFIIFESGKWLAFFPGIALISLVVSINLVGIGLRDTLDVKM